MALHCRRLTPSLFASLLLIFCLGVTARAHAQYYLGGGFGQSRFSGDTGAGLITSGSVDKQHSAFQAYGGYEFGNSHFAAEVAYVDLGKLQYAGEFEGTPLSGSVKFSGFNLAAVGSVRLGPSSLFAKAGVLAWSAEASSLPGTIFPGVKNGQDFSYGLGASFDLSPNWRVRAEWEHFNLDAAEAKLVTLGAAYRF